MKNNLGIACTLAVVALGATACGSSTGAPATADQPPTASAQATVTAPEPSASASPEPMPGTPSAQITTAAKGETSAPVAPVAEQTPGPSTPKNPENQTRVLDSLPGNAKPGCVEVGDRSDLRSGAIAAGNFADARAQYASNAGSQEQPEVHLYVIPQHAKQLHSVTVTMEPMSRAAKRSTVTSRSVEQADVWTYFSVHIPVPAPGEYRIRMVAGADQGCFVVDFAKS